MKPNIVTKGIVLARTDYQEADRILTVITPSNGKLRLIAKGVRRPKSKLAGGIELFAVNDITVLRSQRELKTLISSRLHTHYGNIVSDIRCTMLGYEIIKQINRVTEDEPGSEYFTLLESSLEGLNNKNLPTELLELWFWLQLLKVSGHTPDLNRDTQGGSLAPNEAYVFDFDAMCFRQQHEGPYRANHVKLLRLALHVKNPNTLEQVQDAEGYVSVCRNLVKTLAEQSMLG